MKALFLVLFFFAQLGLSTSREAPMIDVSDTINPGTGDYILQQIRSANAAGAPYLVMKLNTPGGLVNTTRLITQEMLNSKIPIVVFVSPKGAHAGSAGALIAFASDVAVMAPGTNIGAAHPVGVSGGDEKGNIMSEKVANDVAAFAESLAAAKGRNREWAVKAVKQSESIPSDQALKTGVIDLIVDDVADLELKLQNFTLKKPKGEIKQLPAERVKLVDKPMNVKQQVVTFLSDPNISYLLMTIGGICIWLEISHPGMIYPGIIGALCLVISLVSLQTLPIRYGALALILFGICLLIAELYLPTFGLLGIAGIISFVLGSLFLMDTPVPEFQISLKLIVPTALTLFSIMLFLSWVLMRVRKTKQQSGLEALIGEFGQVREKVTVTSGKVLVQGELWNAKCEAGVEINAGSPIKVLKIERFELLVSPVN